MPWLDSLNLSKISKEDRFRILKYVVSKVGREMVQGSRDFQGNYVEVVE